MPTTAGPAGRGRASHGSSAPCNQPATDPVLWYNHSTDCNVITVRRLRTGRRVAGLRRRLPLRRQRLRQDVRRPARHLGRRLADARHRPRRHHRHGLLQAGGSYALYYTTYADGGQLHKVIGPASTGVPPAITDTKFSAAVSRHRVLDTRAGTAWPPASWPPVARITLKVTGGDVPANAKAVVAEPHRHAGRRSRVRHGVADRPVPAAHVEPERLGRRRNGGERRRRAGRAGRPGQLLHLRRHPPGGRRHGLLHRRRQHDRRPLPRHDRPDPPARHPQRGRRQDRCRSPPGQSFDLQVGGKGGVPDDATGVALTVTYTGPTAPGYLTVWPTGQPQPLASTTNPNGVGDIRSNLAMIPLGAGGKVSIFSFAPDGRRDRRGRVLRDRQRRRRPLHGGDAHPDRRLAAGVGALRPHRRRRRGHDGLQHGRAPATPPAALYNLTATNTVAGGYLTAHASGTPVPDASSVNWSAAGQSRAALTISSLASRQEGRPLRLHHGRRRARPVGLVHVVTGRRSRAQSSRP